MFGRKIYSNAILFAGAVFAFLSACSNGEDTAGVISETESGKTIAGIIVDENGEPMKNTHVALIKRVNSYYYDFPSSLILEQTLSDSLGQFHFENIPASSYSLMASNQDLSQDNLDSSMLLLGYARIPYTFADTLIDTLNYRIQTKGTAKLLVSTSFQCYGAGNQVYLEGTFAKVLITEEDIKRGYIEINGIPADSTLDNNPIVAYNKDSTCFNSLQLGTTTLSPGKTLYMGIRDASPNIIPAATLANVVGNVSLKLPTIVQDSFPGYEIDSLFLPVKFPTEGVYSITTSDGNIQRAAQGFACGDSVCYWAAVPFTQPSQSLLLLTNYEQAYHQPADLATYRVTNFSAEIQPGTSLKKQTISKDTSFAISFWINSEGTESDSTQGILTAMKDGIGFTINSCEKDRQFACTNILTGLETSVGDSIITIKAKILDGARHHYSLVLHKKHLTIAIDGITIRDTDLKLSPLFYGIDEIITGDYALGNFLLYSFGSYIRKDGEKDWTRLKAWLMAFYEMQNLLY